ncbi:MAG: 4Fe-4S binding protein, partial [Gemmataceae bacterium]
DKAVKCLTELLFADHLHPDPTRDDRYRNELVRVGDNVGVKAPREGLNRSSGRNDGKHPKSRPLALPIADDTDTKFPYSARTIAVDHDRCILCDRCVRACSEVKPFQVIGHTGKGYQTRISFDLDLVMNDSSCVQCGECMTSCPTGALTFRRRVAPQAFDGAPAIPADPTKPLPEGYLTAREMRDLTITYTTPNGNEEPFYPFKNIPLAYLKWNEGAVRRRRMQPGEVVCEFGEYGNTAFLLESGSFQLSRPKQVGKAKGLFQRVFGSGSGRGPEVTFATLDASATILGELACLSSKPRAATVRAAESGVVYEVTRNLLDMAQRSREARDVFNTIYRRNAVKAALAAGKVFKDLTRDQFETVEQ